MSEKYSMTRTTIILRWTRQLASALIAAHRLGVTHRAVQPSTIHLSPVHTQPQPQSQPQLQAQARVTAVRAPTPALHTTEGTAELQSIEQQGTEQQATGQQTPEQSTEQPTEGSAPCLESFAVKLGGFRLSIEGASPPSLDPGAAADLDRNSALDCEWSSSDESDDSGRESRCSRDCDSGVEGGRRSGKDAGGSSLHWRDPPFHPAADAWGVGGTLFELITLLRPPSYDRRAPPPPPLPAFPEGAASAARAAAETAALSVAPHPLALKRLASRQMLRNPDASRRTTLPELLRALDELEAQGQR